LLIPRQARKDRNHRFRIIRGTIEQKGNEEVPPLIKRYGQ
jgi:hypothetical protein